MDLGMCERTNVLLVPFQIFGIAFTIGMGHAIPHVGVFAANVGLSAMIVLGTILTGIIPGPRYTIVLATEKW